MAVKKPVYRYQYKPTTVSYFKPKLSEKQQLAQSVGTQVTNLEKRFQDVGVPTETGSKEADSRNLIEKALNLKADQNALMDILEVLNRPTQVVTNVLSSLGEEDKRNALQAAWDGLSGRKEINARQALVNLTGNKDILKIKEDPNTKWDDIGQFVIDMGLEIVADPTTWIGLGVGAARKAAQETAEQTAKGLIKKAGEIAEQGPNIISNLVGTKTDWGEVIQQSLIDEAKKLLTPKPTLVQQGFSIVNSNLKKFTRNAIMKLPRDQAKQVIKGLRGLKNISERAGSLFDAFKDVGDGLRGKLDEVFGTANYKLDLIKSGIKNLDDNIEVMLKRYQTLPELGGGSIYKGYRSAVEEIYEAGFQIDRTTGRLVVGKGAPRGKMNAADIASDLANAQKGNKWVSRPIGEGNMPHVIKRVRELVTQANEAAGEGFLTYSVRGRFISIQLNIPKNKAGGVAGAAGKVLGTADDIPLSDAAFEAFVQEEIQKYRKFFAETPGIKGASFDTGKIPVSPEAQKLLLDPDMPKIIDGYDGLIRQADDLMRGSVAGIPYSKQSIYQGKLPEGMRYVRRVRTKEYLKELSKTNRFEPNPLMKEIVSGTGKELDERLYRGTTREYNEILKTFYGAKDDRFSQDLIESLIDYVKVADSRFSQAEVTRMIFGLDIDYDYGMKRVGNRLTKPIADEEYITGRIFTGKVKDLDINNPVHVAIKEQATQQGFKLDDVITIGDSPNGKYATEARFDLSMKDTWDAKDHEIDNILSSQEAKEQYVIQLAKKRKKKVLTAQKTKKIEPPVQKSLGPVFPKKDLGEGVFLVEDLSPDMRQLAHKNGFTDNDVIQIEKTRVYRHNQDWAQDSQFLRPVDQMVNPEQPLKRKKGDFYKTKLNVQKSDVVTKEMAEDFKRRFPNHRILKDGFVNFDSQGRVVGGEFKQLFESLPKDLQVAVRDYLKQGGMLGKNMTIHNSAYEILKNAQNAYKININPGIKFFDKFLNFWKGVTLLSPSFHIRNWIGNWTNMGLAGMNPQDILRETSKAWQEIAQRQEILKKIANGTATIQERTLLATSSSYVSGLASARRGVRDLENLAELRRYSPKLQNRLTGQFGEQYQALIEKNFALAERADEVQRLAMFNHLKRKGMTEAQAIQRVREVLFDYGKLTGFEKDYMKRILPFYTFMKENLQFQFKNVIENSPRYRNLFKGYKHYLEEVADLDEKDIPQYMSGNMWLPLPFTFNKDDKEAMSLLKLNLPASDFAEFIDNPLKKTIGGVAVPIKATWEFFTGIDTFTGSPIQQFPGQKSMMREGDSLFKFLRNEKGDFDVSKNPTIKKFVDDLGFRTLRRPLTAVLDSIDTILGRQDIATGLFDVLEQTGITTTVKKEDLNLNALYQQLEYLRNLKKLWEQNTGQKLPSQAELAGYKYKPK